jgi:hypothetical protein
MESGRDPLATAIAASLVELSAVAARPSLVAAEGVGAGVPDRSGSRREASKDRPGVSFVAATASVRVPESSTGAIDSALALTLLAPDTLDAEPASRGVTVGAEPAGDAAAVTDEPIPPAADAAAAATGTGAG